MGPFWGPFWDTILSGAAEEALQVTLPPPIVYKQWLKLGVVGGIPQLLIPALGRLRQGECHEFEACLDLLVSSRSDWDT